MHNEIKYLWLLVICISSLTLHAQYQGKRPVPDPGFSKRWSMGITLGPDFYYGDKNPDIDGNSSNLSFAGSLFFHDQISNVFGLRIQLLGAWLNGSVGTPDSGKIIANPFTGILLNGNISGTVNFTNLISPYRSSRWFFLYGILGIGYSGWYTELVNKVYDAGTIDTDNPLNNFHAAAEIPAGLGALCKVGDRFNFSVEYTFRFIFSDLLDQTVSGSNNDRFDYLAFGIGFNLGKSRKKSLKLRDYTFPTYTLAPPQQPVPQALEPKTSPSTEVRALPAPPPPSMEPLTYVVQIFAFSQHQYSPEWIQKHYHIPLPVRMEKEGVMERFLVGNYPDLQSANQVCQQMKRLGIRDAFVVIYKNGLRQQSLSR